MNELKSPLKWAGGKKDIISIIQEWINIYINKNPEKKFRLVDLFCGGLSVSLKINHEQINSYLCNDINRSLIHLYETIQSQKNIYILLTLLEGLNNTEKNTPEEFYNIRSNFNNDKKLDLLTIEHSAHFIYLNKRCFNGLYRENSKGVFNVPYRKNNSSIYDKTNILDIHKKFNNNSYEFISIDYKNLINTLTENDIVYIDPPYYPIDGKSSFTQYHSTNFLVKNQKELAEFVKLLHQKNIPFILSNTPCNEIRELYKDFYMEEIHITREMRSARGKTRANNFPNEILITNIFLNQN